MRNHVSFRHERLEVYRNAREFTADIFLLTKKFPREATIALIPQLQRASLSIVSNIAEGAGRLAPNDQARFTSIAYASLLEVVSQLDLAHSLGWISDEIARLLREKADNLARQLSALHAAQRRPKGDQR